MTVVNPFNHTQQGNLTNDYQATTITIPNVTSTTDSSDVTFPIIALIVITTFAILGPCFLVCLCCYANRNDHTQKSSTRTYHPDQPVDAYMATDLFDESTDNESVDENRNKIPAET